MLVRLVRLSLLLLAPSLVLRIPVFFCYGRAALASDEATAFPSPPTTSSSSTSTGEIRVIGAGLGRTGTYTLASALTLLGYRTQHFIDLARVDRWADWAEGRATDDDMIDMMTSSSSGREGGGDGGHDAAVENPTADIYVRILERYPDSMVILTIRDSPSQWARSWMNLFDAMGVTDRPFHWTFPSPFQFVPLFRHLKKLRCKMGTTHLGLDRCELTGGWRDKDDPRGWLAQQYEAHNYHVMTTVPSDRLLVYNVREGWGPLCHFLGKDLPRAERKEEEEKDGGSAGSGKYLPFPNASAGANDAASLRRLRTALLVVVYGWIPMVLIVVLLLARCIVGSKKKKEEEEDPNKEKQA